jgi:hypothetical protein
MRIAARACAADQAAGKSMFLLWWSIAGGRLALGTPSLRIAIPPGNAMMLLNGISWPEMARRAIVASAPGHVKAGDGKILRRPENAFEAFLAARLPGGEERNGIEGKTKPA